MRTNWASGDKVTAADLNEISTMLTRHDTTVDAHDGALSSQANAISAAATAAQEAKDAAATAAPSPATSGFVLVPAGQPAPTDLPDGTIVVMEDPTGGTVA